MVLISYQKRANDHRKFKAVYEYGNAHTHSHTHPSHILHFFLSCIINLTHAQAYVWVYELCIHNMVYLVLLLFRCCYCTSQLLVCLFLSFISIFITCWTLACKSVESVVRSAYLGARCYSFNTGVCLSMCNAYVCMKQKCKQQNRLDHLIDCATGNS